LRDEGISTKRAETLNHCKIENLKKLVSFEGALDISKHFAVSGYKE
jgi:hypothetical protein